MMLKFYYEHLQVIPSPFSENPSLIGSVGFNFIYLSFLIHVYHTEVS